MDFLIGSIIMFGGPALYCWLQWRAISAARGLIQWFAALVPIAIVATAAAFTSIGLSEGSNIAPIILVFSFPVAVIWLVIGECVRKLMSA